MLLWACLGVAAPGCEWEVGSVNVRLVATPDVDFNPMDQVRTLRVRIEADDLGVREQNFEVRPGGTGTLGGIPLGQNRILTVEGLTSAGFVKSRGISAPFDTHGGDETLYLFFSLVGTFAQPSLDPTAAERYLTEMGTKRIFHTATALPSGEVLVAGGNFTSALDFLSPSGTEPLRTVMRFDPTAGAFRRESESADCKIGKLCLLAGRAFHTAELLADAGLVLLVGGEPVSAERPAEVYRFGVRTAEVVAKLVTPRTRHAAALIGGFRPGVIVAGGLDGTGALQDSVELREPAGFDDLAPLTLSEARAGAIGIAVPGDPGSILIIGGWSQWQPARQASARVDRIRWGGTGFKLESFDMLHRRAAHAAVLLEDLDGAPWVLVCGGLEDAATLVDSCELIDPLGGTTREIPGLMVARFGHAATALRDGRVLLTGGFANTGGYLVAKSTAFLVSDPLGVAHLDTLLSMAAARAGHTATRLPNGMVVLIGGVSVLDATSSQVVMASADYEIFNPE